MPCPGCLPDQQVHLPRQPGSLVLPEYGVIDPQVPAPLIQPAAGATAGIIRNGAVGDGQMLDGIGVDPAAIKEGGVLRNDRVDET